VLVTVTFVPRDLATRLLVASLLLAVASPARAEPEPVRRLAVRAARLLDPRVGRLVSGGVVLVEGERIVAAGANLPVPPGAQVIELGDATILPGLIDCHTHLMARIADGPHSGYAENLLTKPEAFRALEGAANARATLLGGFTSVRDVESEGSGYADAALRDAIAQGLVDGPRMLVATRGIASVGDYFPFGVRPDLERFPTGAQLVSGVEEARRAAREQLGHGADLLKVYADWDHPTLTLDELRVVVDEAHRRKKRVAAHADSIEGIRNAIAAGVDSIEHGAFADRATLLLMKQKGVVWVPTRAAFYEILQHGPPQSHARMQKIVDLGRQNLAIAAELGVEIAVGFDASGPDDQGHNARELIELHRLGVPALAAIRAATLNAAELLGRPRDVGSLDKGAFADVIAVPGDPLGDLGALEHVLFVMKGGVVVKNERKAECR
jgi:imidazolonepropionase-like amidohydrolase